MDDLINQEVALEGRAILLLDKFRVELDQYSLQQSDHIDKGKVIIDDRLLDRVTADHRTLFDHYEMLFISTFMQFALTFLENFRSPLIGFASRTFIEMGFKIAPILFSDDQSVPIKRKMRYKAMLCLKDLLFINKPEDYRKLLEDTRQYLESEDVKRLSKACETNNLKKLSHYIDQDVKPRVPEINLGPLQEPMTNEIYMLYSDTLHSGSLVALGMNINSEHSERHTVLATTLMLECTLACLKTICSNSAFVSNPVLVNDCQTVDGAYRTLYPKIAKEYLRLFVSPRLNARDQGLNG